MLPSKFKRYTDESQPLVVDTQVAKKIGLNESIVIRQLHYWLKINEKTQKNNIINEKVWCYNSIKEWKEGNFDFWSGSTIRRAFESLAKHNLIETMPNPRNKWSKEKWYTINYLEYSRLFEDKKEKEAENPIDSDFTKMHKSKLPKCTNRSYQNEQMNIVTENTSKNTTDIKEKKSKKRILDYSTQNRQLISDFFATQDLHAIIKNLKPKDNSYKYDVAKATATLDLLQENLLEYYTNTDKGKKRELKNMKLLFRNWASDLNDTKFYSYDYEKQKQEPQKIDNRMKQPEITIDRKDYVTQDEFEYDIETFTNRKYKVTVRN